MQYLVFGALLVLGAVVMGLFLYLSHVKNKAEAVVLGSYCDIKRNEQEIENIKVTHVLEFEIEGEKKKVETDLFPVRELNGAKLTLYYNKKKEEVYVPDCAKYYSFLTAFFLSGVICFALYWSRQKPLNLLQLYSEPECLAFLLGMIAVVTFSYVTVIINPAVLRTKGNFEGIWKSEYINCEVEVYSLWYGEHRQYARRMNGMLLKQKPDKAVTLFFNTKTGRVYRLHELVVSMCVSAAAFLAMILILLFL